MPCACASRPRLRRTRNRSRRPLGAGVLHPRLAKTSVGDWVARWVQAHDVSGVTQATYDSHLRNHILPRFAGTELGELSRMVIKAWAKSCGGR